MRYNIVENWGTDVESTERSITVAGESFLNCMLEVKQVAILGIGIQGCLMALMFRKYGYDVACGTNWEIQRYR